MPIFIVADHAGFELKTQLLRYLYSSGLVEDLIDLSPNFLVDDDYPDRAKDLAKKMSKTHDFGIAICGTGQGICMALNRFKNVRAAVLSDIKTTKLVRLHNDANVICLSGRNFKSEKELIKAVNLIKIFLSTKPSQEPRHLRRIQQLS